MLHAHPFREGNGRSIRIWIEDLADAAGHDLRWERSSAERNMFVEPMRALLTQVAGGSLGVDRPVDALDDLHELQHALAWTRVGLAFGTDEDREHLGPHATDVISRIGIVRRYLDSLPSRATTRDQPAEQRWRGLAASLHPDLAQTENWPQFAAELDSAVTAGVDVAGELHRIVSDVRQVAKPRIAPCAGRRPRAAKAAATANADSHSPASRARRRRLLPTAEPRTRALSHQLTLTRPAERCRAPATRGQAPGMVTASEASRGRSDCCSWIRAICMIVAA